MGKQIRKRPGAKFQRPKPNQRKPQQESGSGLDPKRKSRVTLLPVDPYLIHAYWEIIDEDLERARSRLGSSGVQAKPVLRFYDITYIRFDGKNAHSFFDVEIDPAARNWYVHLWSPEKSYCADLGLKTSEQRFLAFVRSNVTHTPPAWPSIREQEPHMRLNPESEVITGRSTQLSIPSQGESAVGGEPRGLGWKGASQKVKELNPAVPSIDRGMRNFDLAKLNEQHFCGGISSFRPQSEEE